MQTITGEIMAHWVEPETMSRYVIVRVPMDPDDPDDLGEADNARLGGRSDSSAEEVQELRRHQEGPAGGASNSTAIKKSQ